MPGNLAALKHGGRSSQVAQGLLDEQAEAVSALAEKRQAIEEDLGGPEHLSRLKRDAVTRYLELDLVCDYLGQRIVQQGPLTAKGRTRAALSAYLQALDRLTRLAQVLGFERHARRVPDLREVLSGE